MQVSNIHGTLSKHRDKWRIVISFLDSSGKRKQKTFATGLSVKNNKRKAEQMLGERLKTFEQECCSDYQVADITVSEMVQLYLDSRKGKIRDTTLYNYNSIYDKHIKEFFADKKIKDITPHIIDNYYSSLADVIADSTINNVCSLLNSAFDAAVRQELLVNNPCKQIKRQHHKTIYHPQHKRHLTANELNTLLDTIKDEHIYPIVVLAAYYGLRRGEILGLTWDNIDFANKVFYIKRTMAKTADRTFVIRDYCKNKSSERICTMTDDICRLLMQTKQKQEQCKQLTDNKFNLNKYDFVFTKVNGQPYTTGGLSEAYAYMLNKYSLPKSRLHDLRHTAATLMFDSGADATTVQYALGHSSVNTTLNIYVHNTDTANSKAANIMADVIHL